MPMLAYVLILLALILAVAQLRRSASAEEGSEVERKVSMILLVALMVLVIGLILMLAWGTEMRRL